MDLVTIARLTALFQRPPQEIARELGSAKILPSLRLNGLEYFDSTAATEAIARIQDPGRGQANRTSRK